MTQTVALTTLFIKLVNQALIKFRDWRADFEKRQSTVTETDIPKPFTDLIALLAHERYAMLENVELDLLEK